VEAARRLDQVSWLARGGQLRIGAAQPAEQLDELDHVRQQTSHLAAVAA